MIEYTMQTEASPNQIWKVWEDVKNWNTWDSGLEFSEIDGPFYAGMTGSLKPKGGPLVRIKLTAVKPLRMFVSEACLPGTKIIVGHFIKRDGNKTYVTHRIEIKGIFSWFFSFVIGRKMKKNLPAEMQALARKAEKVVL